MFFHSSEGAVGCVLVTESGPMLASQEVATSRFGDWWPAFVQGRSNPVGANVRIQDSEGSARAGTVRAEGAGNGGCLRKTRVLQMPSLCGSASMLALQA